MEFLLRVRTSDIDLDERPRPQLNGSYLCRIGLAGGAIGEGQDSPVEAASSGRLSRGLGGAGSL